MRVLKIMQKPIKNFEKYAKTENNCLLKNRGYLRFMYSDIRNFQRELQKKQRMRKN